MGSRIGEEEDSAFVELFFDEQNKKRKKKRRRKKNKNTSLLSKWRPCHTERERERERERDLERTEGNKTQSTHSESGGPQKRNRQQQQRQYTTTNAQATTRSPSSFPLFVSTSFIVGSLSVREREREKILLVRSSLDAFIRRIGSNSWNAILWPFVAFVVVGERKEQRDKEQFE
jgi:hypothetical protein